MELAESKYITGKMYCETCIFSNIFVINFGRKRHDHDRGYEEHGHDICSEYICDIGYSDIEIKFMLAHHIYNLISAYQMNIKNIADIYSKIKPRRFSGFYYQYPIYPYYWFSIHKIRSTKYTFTTCYDRRKCPIVAIALHL